MLLCFTSEQFTSTCTALDTFRDLSLVRPSHPLSLVFPSCHLLPTFFFVISSLCPCPTFSNLPPPTPCVKQYKSLQLTISRRSFHLSTVVSLSFSRDTYSFLRVTDSPLPPFFSLKKKTKQGSGSHFATGCARCQIYSRQRAPKGQGRRERASDELSESVIAPCPARVVTPELADVLPIRRVVRLGGRTCCLQGWVERRKAGG